MSRLTSSRVAADFLSWLIVVCLVPLAVIIMTPTMLIAAGWLDPYVYSAYIYDYRQTFQYFGATYYSLRVAAIGLSRLMRWFVHSDASYYVVRYVLLALASTSIYAVAR